MGRAIAITAVIFFGAICCDAAISRVAKHPEPMYVKDYGTKTVTYLNETTEIILDGKRVEFDADKLQGAEIIRMELRDARHGRFIEKLILRTATEK